HGFDPGLHLYAPLGEAARLSEPIAESLQRSRPGGCELDTAEAHAFLAEASPVLEQAGFGVLVPAWWRARGGRWQLNLRANATTAFSGGRRNLDSLNLATLVGYDWRVALGDVELTRAELDQLASQKTPLVHVRGRWVELDAEELAAALAHLDRQAEDPGLGSRGSHTATVGDLLAMSVPGVRQVDGLPVGGVDGDSDVAELLERMARHELPEAAGFEVPAGLRAELRPYQLRGAAWLASMAQLGLGACLADDMGLGKTVQTLAVVLDAWERDPAGGPTLIVCPTSVVTNWTRELEQFTPDLPWFVQHGSGRRTGDALVEAAQRSGVVFTSYAVLARDIQALVDVPWRMVVLDEAQNIKNPSTRHSRAARSLRAPARVVLTGTPVENHVGDLWSIMEFLNPGLLGSQAEFRRRYLLPIQTGSFPEAVERLRQLTGPFILRREKTDRTVISDLPDKFERTDFCTMTAEQVGLYEAIVRDAEKILLGKANAAVERRGVILATLSKLKQACNHPAQLLADNSQVLGGRSGKLTRLEELIELVLESRERALVFTQFVGMGELLQKHLEAVFGREVLFLHGGTSRRRRDELVQRFQDADDAAPPILILSLKAGGSGLNLTAATHVIHYDRWWNPATEQQASDRAFRIGQTRDVQVHALVCAGTVEERIDTMLRQKASVARTVIGSGERWITELDDAELLGMLQLRQDTLLGQPEFDDVGRKWGRVSL
ncbi:MAG: helicase, partial [Thermoleophilia bacterium]|nr:helicase [Thermoleophilia bacterium]